MKTPVLHALARSACAVLTAMFLTLLPAQAAFDNVLFSDNFLTTFAAPGGTTDLNSNVGLAGGRQSGYLVSEINPAGFGWGVFGTTVFPPNNGWDLRAQTGFPATGPIDTYTLRFRHETAGQWSTVTPNIGFNSFIVDNSYRIQAQVTHAHLDFGMVNDRWAGISFGAQPEVRFPAFDANAGVVLFASGAYSVFSEGALLGNGSVMLPANGVANLDLQVLNNSGSLFINGELVQTGLDFSATTPAWVGLSALSGTSNPPSTLTQFRFDNFVVSTVPEPSAAAFFGTALVLLCVRRARRLV